MTLVHFYDETTGRLARKVFRTSSPNASQLIAANTPEGHAPVVGIADRESQRVDLQVAHRIDELEQSRSALNSPQEMLALADEIDGLRRRLIVTDAGLAEENRAKREMQRRHDAAMQEIEALDRLQIRSISALFDNPSDRDAREHFNRRKARISELREIISGEADTTESQA